MRELPYNRAAAVAYAQKWALSRNPAYYDFEKIGGDCTNFASQCIYAGARIMNYTPDVGWYYISPYNRAAAWSGVEYLYRFLTENSGPGPFGHSVSSEEAMPGDIVQLGSRDGSFYHCPVITSVFPRITVAAHTSDVLDIPLSAYGGIKRFIRIDGVRLA